MKNIIMIFFVLNFVVITTSFVFAANHATNNVEEQNKIDKTDFSKIAKYLGAAIAVAAATVSSGIAIGRIGAAAMGAVSEKPETAGTAMILAALAEGVCLWGIAGAFLILFV